MRWRDIRIKEYVQANKAPPQLASVDDWQVTGISDLSIAGGELRGKLEGEDGHMVSRHALADGKLEMAVPACDKPTVIRMRYRAQAGGAGYAEVTITARGASARLVTAEGETKFKRVRLKKAQQHRFVGVTRDNAVTFTVREKDVLRLPDADLAESGQIQIRPAPCPDEFGIDAFSWNPIPDNPQ